MSAAYTHHLEGVLDLREYELVKAKVERERNDALARVKVIAAELAKYDTRNILENQWLLKYRAFRDSETLTKEMIQTLIKRILLTPMTNEITIELNYTDSFEELRQIFCDSAIVNPDSTAGGDIV